MLHHGNRAASGRVATVTYIGATQDTNNLTSYTFSGVSIGTASADRLVVVGVGGIAVSAGTVSSVTIGGVTANLETQTSSGNAAIASLLVTSGTTATIVVNYTAGRGNCTIYVWVINAAKSTTPISAQNAITSTADTSVIMTGQYGAVGCAVVFTGNTGTSSFTWTGLTENADQTAETRRVSAASGNLYSASSTVTATCTLSGNPQNLACAAWR